MTTEEELEQKRAELRQRQSEKYDRDEERSIDKELRSLKREERHPQAIQAYRRVSGGVKQASRNAWGNARGTARTIAKSRTTSRVTARPSQVHMRGPPAPPTRIRDVTSKADIVTQTSERNFFSSGPSELINPNSVSDPRNLLFLTNQNTKERRLI